MAFKRATKQSSGGTTTKMTAPLLEAGGYPARLLQIVDLGMQPGSNIYPEPQLKLEFRFELLDEFMLDEDGKELSEEPRLFSYEVSYNADGYMGDRSNIYKLMDAFEDGFNKDLPDLLGEAVNVTIVKYIKNNKEKDEANKITSVTPMREKDKVKAGPLLGKTLYFDLEEPDLETFNRLTHRGEWSQQAKIKKGLAIFESPLAEMLGLKHEEVPATTSSEPEEEEDKDEPGVSAAGGTTPVEGEPEVDPFA